MVNIDVERARVKVWDSSENQCQGETKDILDPSFKSGSLCANRRSVSFSMWKDKLKVISRRNLTARAKLLDRAARSVGYDSEQYSKPFKGRTRDFKAVITAVRFKQLVLKSSSRKKNLLKEAILANTMKRAEEELLIQGRQRQLRRAQAFAEAKAKECSDSVKKPEAEFMEDDALKSLEKFMQSISSVTR